MARPPIWSLQKLAEVARSQLTNINAIWESATAGTLDFLNKLRSAFNLPSQSDAAELYRQSLQYASTTAGQAALGIRQLFDPFDVPINPDLRSPFGDYGQFRYNVSFGYGGEWRSFIEWSDRPPTQGSIEQAIADYIREHIDVYPEIADIFARLNIGELDIRIRNAQRRY